jgi:hypothetical protein
MRDRDSLILESLYSFILEGKKETIDYLQKNDADQDTIAFFTRQDNKGKPSFPTDHAVVLFNWIKNNPVKLEDVERDYNDFRKYFPNKNLKDFRDYMDFSEQVHAKSGEKSFAQRNKEESGDIDVHGVDKENVIADDEDVLILRGDDEHKCVKYGKGYSFCISRPYGGNMYGNYRLSKESTFYFVYFKKVPKENPKHIMVLDRTKDGWEWTFGENSTKVIEGGWDEVIETFPELEKYEDAFINKPLTDEERDYQRKLSGFARNPRKEKFEQFSYKEKADVLKFGMEIPEDLFDSLDKFLRNEYISVGPNMDLDIFNKLNDKEKERYIKVRKTIINQRGFKTKIDFEILKTLKETDAPIYYSARESGDNPLTMEVNLPLLEKCGYINCDYAIKINMPELREFKSITFNGREMNLPKLEKGEILRLMHMMEIDLLNLKKCAILDFYGAKKINLPELQECVGGMNAPNAIEINLPQLQKIHDIRADNAKKLNIPQLQECGDIEAYEVIGVLNLPQLQKSGFISANHVLELNLPRLQESGEINANLAKKIIIRKHLLRNLILHSQDTQIIHPEDNQVNESRTPKFKEFVANKYF